MPTIVRLSQGDGTTTTGTSVIAVKDAGITKTQIASNSVWKVVSDTTVSGASVAQVDFTNLTGNSDGAYMLVINGIEDAAAGTHTWNLRFNDDGGANYTFDYIQVIAGVHSSANGAGTTSIAVGACSQNSKMHTIVFIYPKVHTLERYAIFMCFARGIETFWEGGGWWTNTADEIIKISIINSAGANIKAGTRIILFKTG